MNSLIWMSQTQQQPWKLQHQKYFVLKQENGHSSLILKSKKLIKPFKKKKSLGNIIAEVFKRFKKLQKLQNVR